MPAETGQIPEHPEEITPEWLSDALGVPIRSVRQKILGEGQGFLGDIVRLHLDSDDEDLPASVVAKLPKLANRPVGELMGVYEREALFFRDFASHVPARIPEIYFSHHDPDAGSERQKQILATCDGLPRFTHRAMMAIGQYAAGRKHRRYLLLMEDLGDFEPGDQLAGASVERCAQILEQFASTHRAFWGSEVLDESFWLIPLGVDAHMRAGIFKRSAPALRDVAPEGMEPYIDKLLELGGNLVKRLEADAPRTLVHCDLRLDNMCFDGDLCAFLDWQLVRSGPAAYDVAYFIGGALSPETPAADELRLLRHYHEALGVADYPFDSFHRDYQRALLASLPALAPTEGFNIDEGRGQEMMQRWRERLLARLENVDLDRLI